MILEEAVYFVHVLILLTHIFFFFQLTRLKVVTQKKLVRDKMYCLENNSEDEFDMIKLEPSKNSTIKNGGRCHI